MKYFLKILIKSKEKNNVFYLVPSPVPTAIEFDGEYNISASVRDDEYGFSVLKDRKYIGGFENVIKPKQIAEIEDGDTVLAFSLTSNKRAVKKYLKNKPGTTMREMEEFYSYIGKYEKIKKRRSRGPLHQTSGMDPDLRDEYARNGDK